jgi:hypothetical protein
VFLTFLLPEFNKLLSVGPSEGSVVGYTGGCQEDVPDNKFNVLCQCDDSFLPSDLLTSKTVCELLSSDESVRGEFFLLYEPVLFIL